jgi:uncharacterized protein YqiB (DUF1249 family)
MTRRDVLTNSRGNQDVTQPCFLQNNPFVLDLESPDNGSTSPFSTRHVRRDNCRLIPIPEMTMTLYHTLYRKLTVLIPTLPEVPEYVKSQVPGFMDLNLDLLSRDGEIITVALSHYYEQNGDLIADPDMVVRIDTKTETVEALTFQDTYTYREVYLDGKRVDVKAKKELNEFLLHWLTNLIDQGHKLVVVKGDANQLGYCAAWRGRAR